MSSLDLRTGVLGYFGCQNAGDDAFFDFWSRSMGAPRSCLRHDLRGLRVRAAILGGGAILNEYFLSRLPDSFETLDLYGCSLPFGERDIARLAPHQEKVGVMHLRSKRDASAAAGSYPQATYVPDLIFGHDFAEKHIPIEEIIGHCEVPPIGFDLQRKNLFLFLSDHYRPVDLNRHFLIESFKCRLAEALVYLAQFYNIVCIPMSMWHDSRDNVFAADVVSKMTGRERVAIIDKYMGPDYIYQAIKSQASLVVSMKYHGIIFAMNSGVPFINIGDTRKNTDLLADSGLDALDSPLPGFDLDRFLAIVKAAESPAIRDLIVDVASRNRAEVMAAMSEARNRLDFSPS